MRFEDEQKKWLTEEQCINTNSEGLVVTKSGKVVIPERSEDLKIRLCVIAHSGGNSGHLGYQAATRKLAEFCWWKRLREGHAAAVQHVSALPADKRRSADSATTGRSSPRDAAQ